jgi:hypothetical protein
MTFPQFRSGDALRHPLVGLADLQARRNHARNDLNRQVGFVADISLCTTDVGKRFDRDVAAIVSDNAACSFCPGLPALFSTFSE